MIRRASPRATCSLARALSFSLTRFALCSTSHLLASERVGEHDADHAYRHPLPEQILTESVTDIDGIEAGETEFALNGQTLHATTSGARVWQTSLEAEWRATGRLGLRLEPSYASARDAMGSIDRGFGLNVAGAYGVFHDFRREIHVQIEMAGRLVGTEAAYATQPGDPALPFHAGVRTGFRFGAVTLRPGFGAGVGPYAHAPLWFGAGLLYGLGTGGRFGFVGVELDADAARRTPFIVAPNLMAGTIALGLPFRIGIAVPWIVGASDTQPSLGLYLRILVRTEVD